MRKCQLNIETDSVIGEDIRKIIDKYAGEVTIQKECTNKKRIPHDKSFSMDTLTDVAVVLTVMAEPYNLIKILNDMKVYLISKVPYTKSDSHHVFVYTDKKRKLDLRTDDPDTLVRGIEKIEKIVKKEENKSAKNRKR
ncbi:MAG: hypothetical protein FD156_1718 [Nitrospirae bacterium]|nr:MAG: hypothetical protein FD156_1718 [Nitrospirota bacterium]